MTKVEVRTGVPEIKKDDQERPTVEIFDIDLDEEVLSHLAITESVHTFRGERLNPILIEDDEIRHMFEWQMDHFRTHGRPATPSVLAEEFELEIIEPETAVLDLIKRLRIRWANNNTRGEMAKIASAFRADPLTVAPMMMKVGRELARLLTPQGDAFGTGDLDRVLELYDKRALAGPGPSLGFKELDDYYGGMRGVVLNIAAPKGKKSWFTVKSLLENILNGKVAWHYSLELPSEETNERLYAMAANIPPWKFIKGALTKEDRKLLKDTADLLDEEGQYKIVKPPKGDRKITTLVERARDAGAEVIFIDQLQYVEDSKGIPLFQAKPQEYGEVLNDARDLSDDGPLWIVHQFNRTAMFSDKMPEMQQAKGAAACEEVSSLILGLWANKDMARSGVTEFGSIASRHFMNQSWEIAVDLNRGCQFECLGIADHDEDE